VFPTTASARRTAGEAPIPSHAVAVPVIRRASRWPVAIEGSPSVRAEIESAIDASPTLRIASPGERGALATVCVEGDTVHIKDATGPLILPVAFPSRLDVALSHVANLGVAQGIRELEGERGVHATELAIELGIVHEGRMRRLPDHGAVVGPDDRYYVNIERRGWRLLFVHVFNINARGTVTLLTQFERGGVALDRRNPSVTLGRRPDGTLAGVGLCWPKGLPSNGLPRLAELVVIATPVATNLSGLETRELAIARNGGNQLQRALGELCDGKCRDAVPRCAPEHTMDGFLVKRLSVLLCPTEPCAERVYGGART
jgi:hypothetical protein